MYKLYAITCKEASLNKIEEALSSGITALQLREKDISESEYIKKAEEVKKLTDKYSVPLIINDNVEVALKVGADGVHLGQSDGSIKDIRDRAPKDFIIGATAKTVEQAIAAQDAGASYLGVGAVNPSPTKKDAIAITYEMLKDICNSVEIPVVAIGGINENNILNLKGSGVDGVAVISAIFNSDNVADATKRLLTLSKEITL